MIGGTRFLGPHVARELIESGHDVTVFHRGEHESPWLSDVRHVRSPDGGIPVTRFPEELKRRDFDRVIHMIAMGEADARAAASFFAGRTGRLLALSSGDVYGAYGRFTGLERGDVEPGLLTEDSPLRRVFYPYRSRAASTDELNYFYEKILVERELMGHPLEGTILRLPKLYGHGHNADLVTMYAYRRWSDWRWTHGYVENVASAIVLAALHPRAANRIYNVGEHYTPTVAERLHSLPPASDATAALAEEEYDFRHALAYDTTRIRSELDYAERVSYQEGLRRTLTPPIMG